MTFLLQFDDYVCIGDTITCEVDGYTITARIAHDETPDAPDQRQDGFWPSLYMDDAGFIGSGNGFRDRFAKAQAKAERVMAAWKNDEWYYCGVILSVALEGITLDDHAASLWGIEANYPDSDNAYLSETANELLPEALEAAKAERARQCAILCEGPIKAEAVA